MPYSFVDENTGQVIFNTDWQWWGERKEGVIAAIVEAKKQNLKVMVKPMMWLKGGGYTQAIYNLKILTNGTILKNLTQIISFILQK